MATTSIINRVKVGESYWQSGYGKGLKKANVYNINGYLYAKDSNGWKYDFHQLENELIGYVRVNKYIYGERITYSQCNIDDHMPIAL